MNQTAKTLLLAIAATVIGGLLLDRLKNKRVDW